MTVAKGPTGIHYTHHDYFIRLSMAPGGIGMLKSKAGKPESPYINALSEDKPLANGIDATLFEYDDGKVYLTSTSANRITRMKDDLSGPAEPPREIVLENPDHDSNHDATRCAGRGMNDRWRTASDLASCSIVHRI